jgi:hypothetical protein
MSPQTFNWYNTLPNYQKIVSVLQKLAKRQKWPWNFFNKTKQKYTFKFEKKIEKKKKLLFLKNEKKFI